MLEQKKLPILEALGCIRHWWDINRACMAGLPI